MGLGKLGLPCALGFEGKGGFQVIGYDVDPNVSIYLDIKKVPYREEKLEEFLEKSKIRNVESPKILVDECDVIFVAVQTPHEKLYEGISPVPDSRKDFDYTYLLNSIVQLAEAIKNSDRNPMIVVISTVLPGTMGKLVLPILESTGKKVRFCYNPYFIAMGTTLPDFLNPEFILVGAVNGEDAEILESIYARIHSAPVRKMSIASAELTKVAYNTFIGFKIVFANAIAEICDAKGANADEVTNALANANVRLMSPKYLSAGMADGGGCHPRDQIAMSWLAKDISMSTDIFGWLANARDLQTFRQATLISEYQNRYQLPILLLGWSYKPETNLTVGSPAILLGHYLESSGKAFEVYDPYIYPENQKLLDSPKLIFVSTKHEEFKYIKVSQGSVVIDPWGIDRDWEDCIVFRPGRNAEVEFIN